MNNKKIGFLFVLFSLTLIIYSCKKDPAFPTNGNLDGHSHTHADVDNRNFPIPNIPADNPLTVEGIALGRMLFYEKMLSRNNTISCASCHNQASGFSDTNKFSAGVNGLLGKRQAMAVFNMLWHSNGFFWDGRSNLLRHQSLIPIEDPLEMAETLPNIVAKLQGSAMYRNAFIKAFNTETVDTLLISKALEQFMNSIISNQSKYDAYLDSNASLTALEERGRFLFFNEFTPSVPLQSGADCAHCHSGLIFMNNKYMNNGLDNDANFTDLGRELVTGNANDRAKFKVPTLRNIELTPPYMHDGRFKTLREVINHYNTGVIMSSTLDGAIQPTVGGLNLTTADIDALEAFLKTLTDKSLATNPAYSSPF
jgi:cytochrome c peroxidase